MKKRIGSKLYNTDTSEMVAETGFGQIYRKQTRGREWFLVNERTVVPLTDPEARAMLGEKAYKEPEPESKRIMIGVDRETHEQISKAARRDGLTISEEMRKIVKNMIYFHVTRVMRSRRTTNLRAEKAG